MSGSGGSGTTTPGFGNLTSFFNPPSLAFPAWSIFTPTNPQASAYTPISADLVAAANANFQQTIGSGLASIQAMGAAQFSTISSLFGTWGQTQANYMETAGDSLAIVARNSAKACSGFFSCLFG